MNQASTEARQKGRSRSSRVILLVGALILLIVLLGLLFPNGSGKSARRVAARNETIGLADGINAYFAEYRLAPGGSNAQIISALRGANPRKMIFFEFPQTRKSPTGEFLDPWGMPYRIDTSDPANPRIYSFGPNQCDDGGAEGSDDVSWR